MTRLVVGPFNRVEGDLEVTLDVVDGVVAEARVTTPLYRGFEQMLVGRPSSDALVIAPRICGICSVSQSMAAVAALRALGGVEPAENGVIAANVAHAAENIADHLTHFCLFFMPDFTRPAYAARPWYAAAVERFAATTGRAAEGASAGTGPAPGGDGARRGQVAPQPRLPARRHDADVDLGGRMRLRAIIRDVRAFFESVVLGVEVERFLDIETPEALAALRGDGAGRPAVLPADRRRRRARRARPRSRTADEFRRLSRGGGAAVRGRGPEPGAAFSPLDPDRIAEDVSHAFMRGAGAVHPARGETLPDVDKPIGYSFAKAPRLGGQAVEVGALARQAVDGQPLIRRCSRRRVAPV